jgi:hypothetical protein
METLPFYIAAVFLLTFFLSVFFFYKAANASKIALLIIGAWAILQTILGLAGFYRTANTIPPRLPVLILPPVIFIVVLFNTEKGKSFIDSLNLKWLTILHIVRIPVELVLFWLFVHKVVPGLMTFEGRNFDILSGISAPFIYYFAFADGKINKTLLLIWNFICLGLVLNIMFNAIFSAPTKFQLLGFEQPNKAFGFFPFLLLPAFVVQVVLFSHLAAIRQLVSPQPLSRGGGLEKESD